MKTLNLKYGKGTQKFIVESEDETMFHGYRVSAYFQKALDLVITTGQYKGFRECDIRYLTKSARMDSKIKKNDKRIILIEE
jgi:hypothetical protein